MDLLMGQKQSRDENTRRLSCHKNIVVKKDYKTTLHLLHSNAKYVELFCSLLIPQFFGIRVVFLCFIPALFLYFLQVHPYLYFLQKIFSPRLTFFFCCLAENS